MRNQAGKIARKGESPPAEDFPDFPNWTEGEATGRALPV